jgi:hypothetical protein
MRTPLPVRLDMAVVVLTLAFGAAQAQTPTPEPSLRGNWTASGANQSLHGTWSARPVPGSPNMANGSWSLVNGSNQIVLTGTWAATKTARSWTGTWSARSVAARGIPARAFSGTWRTEIKSDAARTLGDLLRETLEHEITGAWQSGAMKGTWALSALR